MRTFKKILKPIFTGTEPIERFSLRIQDGVEIYEHEFVQQFKANAPIDEAAAQNRPRLVVVDEADKPSGLVAKTRSEIAGLASILQAVSAAR